LPSGEELDRLYRASWSEPGQHLDETGATEPELARRYARRLAGCLERNDFSGLSILELGAGHGGMLAALAELGARVTALEPYGRARLEERGYRVLGSVDELPAGERFDGIVALEVAEHLPDPTSEFRRLGGRLRQSGWLFLTTPNAAGLRARLGGDRWDEARKAGHLLLFGPRSLETMLERAGFDRRLRLRWLLAYSANPARGAVQVLLQLLALDGALRYLAWRA
jgi:2-polyprenyl-3-methyl-5-hydroxy-6-metoxy-1,4-benzoquinol methylase